MTEETLRLPVAVIGCGDFGRHVLGALRACGNVRVVAAADPDAAAGEAARQAGAAWYDDTRRMLAEARPAAVLLCAPPAASAELIGECASRGVHVWKCPPLGRNLAEAAAAEAAMTSAGLKLVVGTDRRFAAGYRRLRELRPWLGRLSLARAHYMFRWGRPLGWRSSRARAGGGALLELGYHPIDLLVAMLGLPEEVYAVSLPSGAGGEPAPAGPADTDDTAALVLRYADGPTATVSVSRTWGPLSEELCLYGQAGWAHATPEDCTFRHVDGAVLEAPAAQSPARDGLVLQIEAFAQAVLEDRPRFECSGGEGLLTQAVIEAGYLASRTCHAEQPGKLLASHGLSLERCLRCVPPQE